MCNMYMYKYYNLHVQLYMHMYMYMYIYIHSYSETPLLRTPCIKDTYICPKSVRNRGSVKNNVYDQACTCVFEIMYYCTCTCTHNILIMYMYTMHLVLCRVSTFQTLEGNPIAMSTI